MTLNYPLLSIPAYYLLCISPHVYAQSLLIAAGHKINAANPKASLSVSALQGKVPEATLAKVLRAEAAQNNGFEQMPLFAVAVLSSVLAQHMASGGGGLLGRGEDSVTTGLTTFVVAFLAVRSAYTVSYIQIADSSKGPVRSLFWVLGLGLNVYQIYKAAALLG